MTAENKQLTLDYFPDIQPLSFHDLKLLRIELGISQSDAAKFLHVSRSHFAHAENGDSHLHQKLLERYRLFIHNCIHGFIHFHRTSDNVITCNPSDRDAYVSKDKARNTKVIREHLGLSIREVAEFLGISCTSVYDHEIGRRSMKADDYEKLMKFFADVKRHKVFGSHS